MKRFLTSVFAAICLIQSINAVEFSEDDAGMITLISGRMLQGNHYSKAEFNEEISEIFFNNYIDALDPSRMVFLQSDIDEFREEYELNLAKFTGNGDPSPAFKIFERYKERRKERNAQIEELLKSDFDFAKEDSFVIDRSEVNWPETDEEAKALWRSRIKLDILTGLLAEEEEEESEIVERLSKRYERLLKYAEGLDSEGVLQIYLTSLANAYDPHSAYQGPKEAENFRISMNLKLTGIGALLRWEDGYTTIVNLVPGGPAEKSGELNPEDRIVAVSQQNEEPVDTIEMPLSDVVTMIRGPIRTQVTLSILPADGSGKKDVILVRDEIEMKDQHASARIIDQVGNDEVHRLYGVIELPSFYTDCAKDIETLVNRLKAENISGLILDMRSNGGGILGEAVEMAGLFIDAGPIVQVKSSFDPEDHADVYRDPRRGSIYDGPMIVLVNKLSASASEIVAAALQDYDRALIVGDQSTHGKGTVQTVYPLSQMIPSITDPGELKFTISKFYRINGETTQYHGVHPDIVLPSVWDYREIGESSLPNSLPPDSIKPERYDRLGKSSVFVEELAAKSNARIKDNRDFSYVLEDITRLKEQLAETTVSLNLETRTEEQEELEDVVEARKAERLARPEIDEDVYEITLDMIANNEPKKLIEPNAPVIAKGGTTGSAPDTETASVGQSGTAVEIPDPVETDNESAAASEDEEGPLIDPYLEEALHILADYVDLFPQAEGRLMVQEQAILVN